MKRYVKEFANDVINHYNNNELMLKDIKEKKINKIQCVLDDYKNGFITSS